MFKERTEQDADACWVITDGRLWSPERRPPGQRRSLLPPGGSDGRGYRALSRTVVHERPSFRRALLESRLRTLERKAPVGQSRVASRPGVCGADPALARAGDRKRRSVHPALSALSAGVAHGHRPTYLERWPGGPRDTVSLIDRHGEMVLTYAKVHTCDFDPVEATCTPGDDFPVCTLETAQGPVKVGAMICYDREFPESARMLMLGGAELILVPNVCEMERNLMSQVRTRAIENMVAIALTNYATPDANGHSIAFDPIAFTEHGSRDSLVVEAGEQEGVYLASFDLEAIREYRARESWGNAFRKPHRYGLLVEQRVEDPFVRVNIHGDPYQSSKR